MKIECTLTDEEFEQIKPYIDCREFANPIEWEFIFYEPSEYFLFILAINGIEYYRGE